MKFLEKWTKKLTKEASSTVKTEVKKTAVDLLPTFIGIASMIFGIAIFKKAVDKPEPIKPSVSNTHITTNNYFFQQMSEDMIKKILEGKYDD